MRTIVASSNTAIPSPRPNSLSWRSSPRAKAPKTQNMISAATVISACSGRQPVHDGDRVVLGSVVLLADAGEEEHLVVHREPEHDGEHEHRHPRLDRPGLVHPDHLLAPSPLEDHDDDAVRGADGEEVHDHRFQRHEEAAEHRHQEQEAEQEDRADEQRHPLAHVVGEVGGGGRGAPDLGLDAGIRDRLVAQLVRRGWWWPRPAERSRGSRPPGRGYLARRRDAVGRCRADPLSEPAEDGGAGRRGPPP